MRRLITMVILVVALIAVVGFYRGWFYAVSGTVADQPSMTVSVDKSKIQNDEAAVKEKAGVIKDDITSKLPAGTQPAR